tara:strand:+ start:50583 stop:51314 length:732 start_codon:yes stop_codon:yes gene_type:complete
MSIKKHIPNLFTLGNLLCGTLATIAAVNGIYSAVWVLVVVGIFFDFLDGFLARILNVQGELGKQLDSLADMVTSGVVPGILMYKFYEEVIYLNDDPSDVVILLAFLSFILTLSAGYRLAKFNIDSRQSDSFIGLPTPAMSLFVVSLPLIHIHTDIEFVKEIVSNHSFLTVVTLVLCYLMNAELPLFSLKFKSFGIKENAIKYLLIVVSGTLLITVQYVAVPIIIILYIILSIIKNVMREGKKV